MTLLAFLLAACGGDEFDPLDRGGDGGGGDPSACPSGMVEIEAADLALGEWDPAEVEDYLGTIVPQDGYAVGAFCIDRYMFPGVEGWAWPLDGLRQDQMSTLEAVLAASGRRLCSTAELLLASAGPENWRHPYAAEERQSGVCDPDDFKPAPIGTYDNCESPLGVHDFEVRSSWARLDPVTAASVAEAWKGEVPDGGVYGVVGGTSRTDTYYAPSNFGFHTHGPGTKTYTDDSVRVCADIGTVTQEQDARWADERDAFQESGSFATWLGI